MVARITGDVNWSEGTEALVQAVVSSPAVFPYSTTITGLGLALLAVQRGDVAGAQERYTALKEVPRMVLLCISTDRVLGLLCVTMGQLDEAAGHFEDALEFTRRAGYRPELAWTCYDYADALFQRDGPGDRAKASSLLEESVAIAQEVGMRPLAERVAGLQDRADLGPTRITGYPGGLTPREVEVLEHLAQGKTNREIARELVLSERTVQRHISNIYAKIQVRNRAEATTFALRHLPS